MCFTQIAGSQDVIAFDASGQEVFSMESSSTDAFHRGIRVVHLEPARGSWICLSTAASEVALLVIDDGGEKSWVERNLPTSCLTSIHDDNLSHEGYVVAGLEAGSLQVREAANGHLVFRTVRAHDAVIAKELPALRKELSMLAFEDRKISNARALLYRGSLGENNLGDFRFFS